MTETRYEIDLHGFTHGAEAVGRLPDGKACFVAGGIPGERVRVEVIDQRKRWARAKLIEVLRASDDRVDPPCPFYGDGTGDQHECGGCALQHIAPAAQADLKRRVVIEQLNRIGGFDDPPVAPTHVPAVDSYREQARFSVDGTGHLGFRRRGGHEVVPIDRCLLLTEPTQGLREEAGDAWPGVDAVSVRVGHPPDAPEGSDMIAGVLSISPGQGGITDIPTGQADVTLDGPSGPVGLRGDGTVVKHVRGRAYRVSAGSFFQAGTRAAEALVDLVTEAAAVGEGDAVLDLYSGVGLFAKALADSGARITAVESDPSAAGDAAVNLAGLDADVRHGSCEKVVAELTARSRWFDVVVLDPPRRGSGTELMGRLATLEPRTVVYVSCDPAALARDARALVDTGMRLESVVPVDLFAHTAAIESVAVFTRPIV